MAACWDGSASTANTVSADVLIVVVALMISSVVVDGLRILWFPHGFARRSAVVLTMATTRRSRTHWSVAVRTGSQPVIVSADLVTSSPTRPSSP
jgi:hypothetical protein